MAQVGLALVDGEQSQLDSVLSPLQRRLALTNSNLAVGHYIAARATFLDRGPASRRILRDLLIAVAPELRQQTLGLGLVLAYATQLETFRQTREQLQESARRLGSEGCFSAAFQFDCTVDRLLASAFKLKLNEFCSSERLYGCLPRTSRTRIERTLKSLQRQAA